MEKGSETIKSYIYLGLAVEILRIYEWIYFLALFENLFTYFARILSAPRFGST